MPNNMKLNANKPHYAQGPTITPVAHKLNAAEESANKINAYFQNKLVQDSLEKKFTVKELAKLKVHLEILQSSFALNGATPNNLQQSIELVEKCYQKKKLSPSALRAAQMLEATFGRKINFREVVRKTPSTSFTPYKFTPQSSNVTPSIPKAPPVQSNIPTAPPLPLKNKELTEAAEHSVPKAPPLP
jgi:hypothetical protein